MTPTKKEPDVVVETETVEVEVEKGTRDPQTRAQLGDVIATHLQKWMSVNESEREAELLLEKIEVLAPVVK